MSETPTTFTIVDDVPLPTRRCSYPFEGMVTGQSIHLVGEALAKRARNAAYQFSKKCAKKGETVRFALRKVEDVLGEDGVTEKAYRLWRE